MSVETLWSGFGTFSGRDEVDLILDANGWKRFVQALDDRPSPGPVQLALASVPVDFSAHAVVAVVATRGLKFGELLAADEVTRSGDEVVVLAHVEAQDAPAGVDLPVGVQTRWLVLLVPRGVVEGATSARAEFGAQAVAMVPGSQPVLA